MRRVLVLTFALIAATSPSMAAGLTVAAAVASAPPSGPPADGHGSSSWGGVEQPLSEAEQTTPPQRLLPCPLSVPCRAVDGPPDAAPGEPALAAPSDDGGGVRESIGGRTVNLLPCPQSIPCLAPAGPVDLQDFQDDGGASDGASAPPAGRPKSSPVRRTPARAAGNPPGVGNPVRPAHERADPVRADVHADAVHPEKREVLMAGTAAAGDSARGMLAKAARELAQVNPALLTADNRPTYEEASEFVTQGRAALEAHDNSAALTLGEKARRLVSGLQPAPSPNQAGKPPPL